MRQAFTGLFLLVTLFSSPGAAQEATTQPTIRIMVKAVSKSDSGVEIGVPSRIEMDFRGVITKYDTDPSGIVPVELAQCDATAKFRALPRAWQYTPEDDWKPCSSDPMVLYMTRIQHATVIDSALSANMLLYEAKAPGISEQRLKLTAALEQGDNAAAAGYANEIAAKLRSIGETRLASDFGTAAIYGGFVAMGLPSVKIVGEDFLFEDPRQDAVVMSPLGKQQLKVFQQGAGVPLSGQWDLSTFTALENLQVGG